MYPIFSLAGKNVKIKATVDISEKIIDIIREMSMEPEMSMAIKGYEFRDLSLECYQGYFLAINYINYAKVIYPEKYRDTVFIRDKYSRENNAKTRLIYIGDLWEKGNKRFFRISRNIEGKELIKVRMVNGRIYYKGLRVIVFGKLEEEMEISVVGQLNRTIFAYRWYQ
ncbi:MAG: hypothetical protein RXP30_07160 [Thermoplasmata archaeon]|nr:hypothetical protein [Euryarchaeota archaeon]MVT36469.1 hypothetical protein [Euryarchaeota archaeon]